MISAERMKQMSCGIQLWRLVRAATCVALVGTWFMTPSSHAQILGELRDYIVPDTDAQGRRTELRGDRARTLPNGMIELEGMTAKTFRGDEPDMIIEASRCVFDRNNKVAISDGELSVKTADGRFSIRGRGFRWLQSESRLTISNNVEAVVRTGLLNIGQSTNTTPSTPVAGSATSAGDPATADGTKPEYIEIRSEQFEYVADSARFRGNVRASQGDATLHCGIVTARFARETGQVDRVEAEQNVVFDRDELHAEADRAIFVAKEDRVRLAGNASWRTGDRSGSGDTIVIDNQSRGFRVEGGAIVTLRPESMLPLDWFAASGDTNSPPKALTISSDLLESHPREAVFSGNVRVSDGQGSGFACGVMTNYFSEDASELTRIVAGGGVEFSQGETRAAGERAVYSVEEKRVSLIGQPRWTFPQGDGRSDRLTIHPETKQIEADGNVVMKLETAADWIEIPTPALSPSNQASPSDAAVTNRVIQVMADELYYKPGSAIFLNSVRVFDPQTADRTMRSELLAAFFSADNKLDELIAERDVVIQQNEMVASGGKAIYRVPKGTIELHGGSDRAKPEVRTSGRKYSADRFVIDRSKQLFRMMGHWRVEMDSGAARAAFKARRD